MKICIVGLGSIGQRHVSNIKKVLSEDDINFSIDALRIKGGKLDSRIDDAISNIYHSFEGLPDDYDVIFITNPTAFHYGTVKKLLGKTKHMFIEKPVFEQYHDLEGLPLQENGVYYVACPLRHKKVIAYAKNLIEQGEQIYSVRAVSSSYLPDWRKNIDYRTVYSARKELGGGVELDLIHEWDYITYLFGMPQKMFKFAAHCSDLETDTNDIAVYIAKYADKTAELHLDYFGAETVRLLELFGSRKKYIIDIVRNTINIVSADKEELQIDFGEDDFYLSELQYFFHCIQHQKKSFNEIDRANFLIKFVLEDRN